MKFISSLASFGKINYKTAYLLIPIVVLAFILRIYGLGEENYWADEFITLRAAEGSLDSIISGNRPPLYLLIAHFWIEFFGTSENVTRLLSVFFGIASILLIYSIGKSLLGVKVGILSAFFMSVSQYQIYYSQEFRYYSLFLLLTLISFFFYIRVLKAKRNIYAVIYVLSSILLYYAHDFGIFIIAAQNLYFIINFKSLRFIILTWLLSQIIILLGILPGLIFSINYKVVGPGGIDWLEAPEIWTPFITFNYYLGAGFDYPPIKAIVIAFIFLLTGTFLYSYIIGKERWLESLRSFTEALKSLKNRKSEIY
ncbi:MAG: glycosyltransferase family 39 protein [Candidatus Dadabacteria bacterium]|nr:glycosyltransferase family 39 protein [Candidatus Dadabacteria bacterium]